MSEQIAPQSQASLTDQLESLYVLANRWGYYDAADFLRTLLDAGRAARGDT